MKYRYKELATNTIIFACSTMGARLIMFFLLPLYTNSLTTSEYGVVELIISTINLMTPILTLSITDAVLRFGLDVNIPPQKVLKDALCFIAGVSVLLFILTPFIGIYKPLAGYEMFFAITMAVFMFRSTLTFYLKMIDKNLLFAIDTIMYTLLLAVANIVFLLGLDMGIRGYFLSLITASTVSIIFCCIAGKVYAAVSKAHFDKRLLAKMLKYSSPLILNAISWWIINSSDKYMLEYFCAAAQVGIYSAAAKIPSLLSTVNSLFSQAWTLSSVKEFDTTADRNFYSKTFQVFFSCMIFAAACIVFITKPFMNIYVGKTFRSAWVYVPILLIATLFSSFSSFFGSMYVALRKNISCTISTLICGLVNVVLNIILIPRFNIMGAVIATAAAYIVIGVYRMLDCQKAFYFKINYVKMIIGAGILIAEAVIVVTGIYPVIFSIFCILGIFILYRRDLLETLKFMISYIKNIGASLSKRGQMR